MDFYPDMNLEFKSSFTKTNQFLANTQDETLLPQMGLAARNLLNLEQMTKLHEIRKRHLKKGHQREGFHWD
ncbi:hypothetical protein NUH30_09145 [Leptospira sp. 85282-16]|nr:MULTISPECIES: hypothetical protein [Leptospira]MCT8333837.1 hypothetical protein [Leptospira sp. 85282-16]